jgi:hypothetical protein
MKNKSKMPVAKSGVRQAVIFTTGPGKTVTAGKVLRRSCCVRGARDLIGGDLNIR